MIAVSFHFYGKKKVRVLLPLVLIIKATFTGKKKLKSKQFDYVIFYDNFKIIEQPAFNFQLSHEPKSLNV